MGTTEMDMSRLDWMNERRMRPLLITLTET